MSDIYSVWRRKEFDDGRIAEVVALTFSRARIIVHRDRINILDGW
jgi:hypothetical protein